MNRHGIIGYAVAAVLLGCLIAATVGPNESLNAPARGAILQHERAVLSAELDDARHERESAYVALELLCTQPKSCPLCDPCVPSFKTDCAVPWTMLLNETSGHVKFRKYRAARLVSWWVVSWRADGKKEQPTCRELCEPGRLWPRRKR